MKMRINTFFYSLKQGFKNIFRNKMFSLASIATMSACIFMFGLFFILVTNFKSMVKTAEEGVSVTVFFDEGVTEERIKEIAEQIKSRAEVGKVEYVSAEEAWDKFKVEYFEGHTEVAESFGEDNPLANAANIEVYLSDVSMQSVLVRYISSINGVRKVNQSQDVANTLTDLNRLISYISGGIILILLCVAVFLISNTVAVGISVRKEEIGIMKLIGATNFFVRAPFIVEGVVIGLVGSLIPLILIYYMYDTVIQYIIGRFSVVQSLFAFVPAKELFAVLIPLSAGIGIGLGLIGSILTTRKHLKV